MGPASTCAANGKACRRMSGAVFTTPRAPGPIRRMPERRATATRSAGASADGVRSTIPRTDFAAQAARVACSAPGATATTARSMASGMSSMRSWAGAVQADASPTRTTGPANSWATSWSNAARAGSPGGPSPAITATADGARRRPTERASARCSRSSIAARDASVGSRLSSTSMTPSANWRQASNPARSNTASIRRLSGRTSATRPSRPGLPGGGDQVLEEDRGQAPTPVGLVGLERQLRLVAPPKVVVAADADEQVAVEGHERHGPPRFDGGEVGHLGGGEARLG